MREVLVRVAGPAVVVVVELEAPVRALSTVASPGEGERLREWVNQSPFAMEILASALAAMIATGPRSATWAETLSRDPGGVHALIERLVGERMAEGAVLRTR